MTKLVPVVGGWGGVDILSFLTFKLSILVYYKRKLRGKDNILQVKKSIY